MAQLFCFIGKTRQVFSWVVSKKMLRNCTHCLCAPNLGLEFVVLLLAKSNERAGHEFSGPLTHIACLLLIYWTFRVTVEVCCDVPLVAVTIKV
jgi:hypothetical protein